MPSNRDVKADDVWRAITEAWSLTYLRWPDTIRHDRGVQFVAEKLLAAAGEVGVQCVSIAVEKPNALGIGERIHGPIRRIVDKLAMDFSSLSQNLELLVQAAVKSYNDTVGVDGLVPTLLVFGAYPKVPLYASPDASKPQHERFAL